MTRRKTTHKKTAGGAKRTGSSTEFRSFGWKTHLLVVIAAAVTVVVYSNTLNAPFLFDDRHNITDNPAVMMEHISFENIRQAAFSGPITNRPVSYITFALNYYFHGNDVTGYHVVNIMVHVACGVIFYFLAALILGLMPSGMSNKQRPWIPFFAAFIWMIHPLCTQSVTYIVQRMNSLAAMFYVLSVLLYAHARLSVSMKRRWIFTAGCVLSAMGAFGSKEIAVTLPVTLFLFEWYFISDLNTEFLKKKLLPMVAVLMGVAVLAIIYTRSDPVAKIINGYHFREFTLGERLLTEARVAVFYISLLAFPFPIRLMLDYDYPISTSIIDPVSTLFSLATVLILVIFAVYTAKKERLISFAVLWFLLNLVLESTVFPLEIIFEHRLYLPSMFFILAAVLITFRILRHRPLVLGLMFMVVAVFAAWTYDRNSTYQSEIVFWRDNAKKAPEKQRPHKILGLALAQAGRYEEAAEAFRKEIEIDPENVEAYNNLGLTLVKMGKYEDALKKLNYALVIDPSYGLTHNNLGNFQSMLKHFDSAVDHYKKALAVRPDYAKAHFNLGNTYLQMGDTEAAAKQFKKALDMTLDNVPVRRKIQQALKTLETRPSRTKPENNMMRQ